MVSVRLSVWTKIGQCLEDSFSHCPFPVELVTNRAGQGRAGQGRAWQGRAARAAAVGGRARCHCDRSEGGQTGSLMAAPGAGSRMVVPKN